MVHTQSHICSLKVLLNFSTLELDHCGCYWYLICCVFASRHNNKYSYTGASDDNLLKNIELFDKLSLRFSNRVLFIKVSQEKIHFHTLLLSECRMLLEAMKSAAGAFMDMERRLLR